MIAINRLTNSTLDFGLDDLAGTSSKPAAGRGGMFLISISPNSHLPLTRNANTGGGGKAAAATPADDDDLESLMNSLSNAPQPAAAPSVGGISSSSFVCLYCVEFLLRWW